MIDENIPEGLSDDTALPAIPADPQLEHLRTPPHSLEAEASVLGGLLLDNSAFDHIADIISDADFYRHEHRLIYAAIAQLIGESKPADAVTANEYLQRQGKSEAAGGLPYLSLLTQQVPSASNIRRYAEIVRERAVLRRLIEAGDAIASSAFNPGARPITQIVDDAESLIFKIGEEGSRMKRGFQPMQALAEALIARVQEMADNPNDITGVPTGFIDLDRMTAGFQAGDLIILAARPSMGKTALAINIAEHVALNEELPVAVFSMEMGAAQLAVRIVASIARIDQGHMRTGHLSDDEFPRLIEACEKLKKISPFS